MGFPHCPICVVLAFVSVFMGVTRSYMFHIIFREFLRTESNIIIGVLVSLQFYFSFAKKIERAKVQCSTRI